MQNKPNRVTHMLYKDITIETIGILKNTINPIQYNMNKKRLLHVHITSEF